MQNRETKKWQEEEALRRYRLIAPLVDPETDEAKRRKLREEIARKNGISTRTVYRYEAGYREEQFAGLKPKNREKRRKQSLPANYEEIVQEAIQLKREVPKRSVRQIIRILELEGRAAPGVLKRTTLGRHLGEAGLGQKQLRRYQEKRETTSRRFCRPHRMELLQGDIKYGPRLRLRDGRVVKTYLSSLIDDHSRYILHAEFYANERAEIVEDTFRKAILKYGAFDAVYLDNGGQYVSEDLLKSCAKLGIRVLHAKPRCCESKGKIEKFHQVVDRFLAEIEAAPVHSLEELNRLWKIFLEEDYQKEAHSGIAEYLRGLGSPVPEGGISPETEWMRDERPLKFLDVNTVAEAFLHHEERRIDPAGCFSLKGRTYEASAALVGLKVQVHYDPMNLKRVTVTYRGMEPIEARPVVIGAFSDRKPAIPAGMGVKTERSRFLDALEKKYQEDHRVMADALSFGEYGKAGGKDV